MDKILLVLCVALGLTMSLLAAPDGAIAVLLVTLISIPTVYLIKKYTEDKIFIVSVFLAALLVRLALGLVIHIFELRNIFGPDAITYDAVGERLADIWWGLPVPDDGITARAKDISAVGWGMNYLVALIYFICGKGIIISQAFCGFIGAATAPMVYFCAKQLFNNQRAARISALAIALFPSFIIWSSQLLKDGIIIFLLVFAMTMTLQLQKKFSYLTIGFLVASLFGIIAMRFYIFYMIAAAVAGSFFIGLNTSIESLIRRIGIIVIIGLALTYLGIIQNATSNFERYGNLERVQLSRLDLSQSANSGFGGDIDVSTTEGAIAAIPIGLAYLLFAPFPWQIEDYKTALLLPEMLVWWSLIPISIIGLWYTLKNRLRPAIPVLIFTLMLTLAYSIFQGNIGMAYRQRTQIQVFLFIFIAVGWSIIQERRENRNILKQNRQELLRRRLQADKAVMQTSVE